MESVYEQLGELRGKIVGLRWRIRQLVIEMDVLTREMTLQESPFAGLADRVTKETQAIATSLDPIYEDVMRELGARDNSTDGDVMGRP